MLYLDYNATTPVAEAVLEEMLPVFTQDFGNPSSSHHAAGRRAANLVDQARERVAEAFDANPGRVVFTSGSTEALNLAVKGLRAPSGRSRVLVGATEHKAVLEAAKGCTGLTPEALPVLSDGTLDLGALGAALGDDVALIAVMAVNNETGVVHPVEVVVELARSWGALTLCDATQAVGRIELGALRDVDMIALSGHKIYGPKGVGALVTSREAHGALKPLLNGGGQERGLRGGTLNAPGIVGLGAAVAMVGAARLTEAPRQQRLREELQARLEGRLGGVRLNGDSQRRVCNTLNLRFDGASGEAVLANLERVQASTGSACQSAVPSPSHVLLAMGLSPDEAEQSLRFSLGRDTQKKDIDVAVDDITRAVERVRSMAGP